MAKKKKKKIRSINVYGESFKYLTKKMLEMDLNVTPNQLSWLGFITVIIPAVLFSFNNHIYTIIGVIIFQMSLVLNGLDGAWARAKRMTTKYGQWLDDIFDNVRDPIIVTGIYLGSMDPLLGAVGLIGVVSYSFYCLMIMYNERDPFDKNKKLQKKLKNYQYGFRWQTEKFKRYSMVVLALLNMMSWYVWIIAIISIASCVSCFFLSRSEIKKG